MDHMDKLKKLDEKLEDIRSKAKEESRLKVAFGGGGNANKRSLKIEDGIAEETGWILHPAHQFDTKIKYQDGEKNLFQL